jgi:hypothetical protein
MRHKKLKLSVLILLGIGIPGLYAQEAIPSSGGIASGSGGTASYSVGQVVYTTNDGGENGTVAQGVQQPFEISVVLGIEEAEEINLSVSACPNPTSDYLTLSVANLDASKLAYQLYDINGNLLQSEKITGNEISIFMSNFVPATYFVKVTNENKEVKTFKIIKN